MAISREGETGVLKSLGLFIEEMNMQSFCNVGFLNVEMRTFGSDAVVVSIVVSLLSCI